MKARCEDCGLTYDLDAAGFPATLHPFTCDDCGGAVECEDVLGPKEPVGWASPARKAARALRESNRAARALRESNRAALPDNTEGPS